MSTAFVKMQGLGNDFVVFDGVSQPLTLTAEQVRWIANRRQGIGCDQVLLVAPSDSDTADFSYRIWNADGTEVEHCGNGVRCVGRFLHDQQLSDKPTMTLATAAGLTRVTPRSDGMVEVDMGAPILTPAAIPFHRAAQAPLYPLNVAGHDYAIGAVSMGNPHAVLAVDSVATAPVNELGAAIEAHPDFPNHVNAGFMQIIDRGNIRLRVFERGVGETPACGTGACAAVVCGIINGWLDQSVVVALTGGELVIHWPGDQASVWMTGPATTVFEGRLAAGAL